MNRASSLFSNWQTVRYELLNTRIRDLRLEIPGSRLEPFVNQLHRELAAKKLRFRPPVYLTDSWGCPDRVPVVGIPFYLADERLMRIEEEQTGEVEDPRTVMMFLRHEAGHAINYAYRLFESLEWEAVFGSFDRPYREGFRPRVESRDFVRHLSTSSHGRTYAQKHPDEDFAETFAVWMTPRSSWRRRYRFWPALAKLEAVDRWMRRIRARAPGRRTGALLNPVESMDALLADHYGARAERFRAAANGYVDDRLREVFPRIARGRTVALSKLVARHRQPTVERMALWSGLKTGEAQAVLAKLEERAQALRVRVPLGGEETALLDLTAMAAALAMDFAYTGQLLR